MTMGTIDTIIRDEVRSTIKARQLRAGYIARLARVCARAIARFPQQVERRRSRRALLALNDDLLKDIGISRADAYREGTRSFWD